jgi:N-acetyltransferase
MTNRPKLKPKPIELLSNKVRLKPLSLNDAEGFYRAGNYPELWQWVAPNHCESLQASKSWITESLRQQELGEHIPFVIIDKASGQIAGSTRYCSVRRDDRGIEIGYTFISPQFQRSYINSHAKFLLLQHAFESLGAIRVELKTHEKNQQSRNAIQRIGATFEGILRNLKILPDGQLRNTAMFSITEQEWPKVKIALQKECDRNS